MLTDLRYAMQQLAPMRHDRGTISHPEKADRVQRAMDALARCIERMPEYEAAYDAMADAMLATQSPPPGTAKDVGPHMMDDEAIIAANNEIRRLRGMIEYALQAPKWADVLSILHDALVGKDGAAS